MRAVAGSLALAVVLALAGAPVRAQDAADQSQDTTDQMEKPSQGTIETVHLDAHARVLGTSCHPTRLSFNGRIQTDGPAFVTYRWLRSDGVHKDAALQFDNARGRYVWTAWNQTSTYSGWVQLIVLTPKRMETPKTYFRVHCGTS